jgi:hypothetical protein
LPPQLPRMGHLCSRCARSAPLLRHLPVDELHLIENKGDKISNDLLTLFLVAVQQPRSLTVSEVFPVGGESGAQASSLRPSTDLEVHSESGDGGCRNLGDGSPRAKRAQALGTPFRHGGAGRK